MTTVRNLRSNSQDDDDAAPSPVKQVESVTPAPGASPPARDASTNSVGAGEPLPAGHRRLARPAAAVAAGPGLVRRGAAPVRRRLQGGGRRGPI